MTNTTSRVESTVPIGGNLKMRIEEMDITDYDAGGGAAGESFEPVDINMRRFIFVFPLVVDDAGYLAKYDEDLGAVRLFAQANDGTGTATDALTEAPSGAGVTATVKLVCIGV